MSWKAVRVLVLLLVASFGARCSCGDPCDPNTDVPRCEGNVVATCPQPGVDQVVGANRWIRQTCAADKVCVEAKGAAFCALSSQANALCDGGSERTCEDSTHQLACENGFATYRFPCISCEPADGGADCVGGPSRRCTSPADCAPELTCSSLGFCGFGDAGR